ncbi:cholesterol 7-desaturase nvd-like [Brevipalpus obovatus]|uniref:cholesterol 7-desaturase nvd-like n=1 Tax=Brevipalpus obovatus TaxID=246614 RepID=UPI003D9DFAEB
MALIIREIASYSSLSLLDLILINVFILTIQLLLKLLKITYCGLRFILTDDLCKDYTTEEGNRLSDGPYPNGWMPVAESEQLNIGTVLKVRVRDRDFVLVRDSNGKVHAMDPYCPHNGAHLGGGDVVKIRGEDCIRCPFHEWSFRAEDGVCVDVPYAKERKAPKGSTVKIWPCVEVNNFICIWFHSKGIGPEWFPDTLKGLKNNEKIYYSRIEYLLNCDAYLISENTSDLSHFKTIHDKPSSFGRKTARLLGLGEQLMEQTFQQLSWKPVEKPDDHKGLLEYKSYFKFLGFRIAEGHFHSIQTGPFMFTLYLQVKSMGLNFTQEMALGLTSIHANRQKFVLRMYTDRDYLSKIICRLIQLGFYSTIQGDCPIWQNMISLKNSIYLREEKSMANHRRWYTQFLDGSEACHFKDAND